MLTISRDDISGDEIQFITPEKRFLKLSVAKYFEVIGLEMNRPQVAIVNALNSPKYRFVTAAISRRVGKTFIGNVIAHLSSLLPGYNILIMSPNYSLSQISFEEQEKLLRRNEIDVKRSNIKDRILELHNGSTIRLGSVNQADSVVGRSYDLILFDEAALTAEGKDVFNVQLRPTLDKPNSKALFISTPRGKFNWFAEFYYRGFSDEFPDWVSIRADWKENPRAGKADIDAARKAMTMAEFKQEYEADFNVFEGQIFRFNSDKCVENLSALNTYEMEVFMGLDIGFKDPTAFAVIAYDRHDDLYYIVDEYVNAEMGTRHHAEAVKERMEKYNIEEIYIDSAAAQTRFDWAYEFDIPTIGAKKSVNDGISYVQRIIEQDKLIVHESCRNTLAMLDQYKWDPREVLQVQKPVHDQHSHIADALRYALYSRDPGSGIF